MAGKSFLNVSVLLRLTQFLVGLHSAILGVVIYFFTVPFYQFFFSVDPDNFFFIKQSGLFLFLLGVFYLAPLMDMKRYNLIIVLTIFSKVAAVVFLVQNAQLAQSPLMIYLAALGDGSMAIALSLLTLFWYRDNKQVWCLK